MVGSQRTSAYYRTRQTQELTAPERESYIQKYLPPSPTASPDRARRRAKPIRTFLKSYLYLVVYRVIHVLFSIYIRIRQYYYGILDRAFSVLYYHHRTPGLIKRDLRSLTRLPEHLSVILTLENEGQDGKALERLVDDAAELAAWCACAGIPMLSIYEKTGVLKEHIPSMHRAISAKLHAYFGRQRPLLQLRAPHVPSFLNGDLSDGRMSADQSQGHLSVLLISAEDGRESIVDLTKTLVEMAQRGKLSAADISLDLIDVELTDNVMGEPELLIVFSPYVELQGYPPWQVRLTEVFHMQDNSGVGYQVFLRALHRYAKAQMRFGR